MTSSSRHASGAVLFATCGLLLLTGCPSAPPTSSTATSETENTARANSVGEADENCLRVLENVLVQLSPENFGQTSDIGAAVSLLNSWSRTCREELPAFPEGDRESLDRLFSEAQREVVLSDQYIDRDAIHLRNSAMFYDIARHVAVDGGGVQQAERLFEFVCRNVQLVPEEQMQVPVPPFDVMLLGFGTAADRAWAFVETLRQLRVDCIVLRPTEDPEPNQLIVGVCLEDGTYLFDPRLGVPLAKLSDAQDTASSTILTWQQVQADKSLLQPYAGRDDAPHWLAAVESDDVRPLIVGEPSLWAPRMAALENILIGTRTMLIYEPVLGDEGLPGLLTRVGHAVQSAWPIGQIGVWDYPATLVANYEAMNTVQQESFVRMLNVLAAPIPVVGVDQTSHQIIYGNPERTLRKTRLLHLNGDFADAVARYSTIRLACKRTTVPPVINASQQNMEIVRIHFVAQEDCLFWSGLCKFEQGEFDVAEDTFSDYLTRYRDKGRWRSPARRLLAECLVELGDVTSALEVLEETITDDPQADANAILQRRLQASRESASK